MLLVGRLQGPANDLTTTKQFSFTLIGVAFDIFKQRVGDRTAGEIVSGPHRKKREWVCLQKRRARACLEFHG